MRILEKCPEKMQQIRMAIRNFERLKIDHRKRVKNIRRNKKNVTIIEINDRIYKATLRYIKTFLKHREYVESLIDYQALEEIKEHPFYLACVFINKKLDDTSLKPHEIGEIKNTAKKLLGDDAYVKFKKTIKYIAYLERRIQRRARQTTEWKRQSSMLSQNYVKKLIKKTTGIQGEIPNNLINLKRDQIKLYRELKEVKENLNGTY